MPKLYLIQHGEAKKKEEDPQRPLTEKGRKDTLKIAEFLAKINIEVDKIIHSGKLRAKQTAEIIAEKLGVNNIEEDSSLAPLAPPEEWAKKLETINENIMLVGHLPHLSLLASLLLTGNKEVQPVKFTYSGVVCLEKIEGQWKLVWMITPQIIA